MVGHGQRQCSVGDKFHHSTDCGTKSAVTKVVVAVGVLLASRLSDGK